MSDTSPAASPAPTGLHRSQISRKWLIRTLAFGLFALIFGCWGLYDATIAYPNRGINAAEKLELEYLRAAEQARVIDAASVTQPAEELTKLRDLYEQQMMTNKVDAARLQWLDALHLVGRAKPEYTTITDPRARKTSLEELWSKKQAFEPLAKWDLPMQWAITAAGFGAALWLLALIVMVKGRVFTWDSSTQTLGLPGGVTLTPADVEDFDKRKWEKFLIFLKIKSSHAQLGGQELKLDLLRYEPLESWVLEMEKTAFPERAAQAAGAEKAADATSADQSSDAQSGSQVSDSHPVDAESSDKPAA